jgi:hypothetical protein
MTIRWLIYPNSLGICEGDYLLYQNRNAGQSRSFSPFTKFGTKDESVTLLRLGTIYEKVGEYNLALSQYQSILEHHNDGFIVTKLCFFRQRYTTTEPDKTKPLYENYF